MSINRKSATVRWAGELNSLKTCLDGFGLEVKPTIHVNGAQFPTAIATVDFGAPLVPLKITSDQSSAMSDGLRSLARAVIGRDTNIRISNDGSNGIYWANIDFR
jgi:hypothetical protein